MPPVPAASLTPSATVHTSPESFALVNQAANLNNRALQHSQNGDWSGAERMHLEALELKMQSMGPNAYSTSTTHSALGELYLKMNRLDEAEAQLHKAVTIRNVQPGPASFDTAVSRESLAQVYEAKGDLKKAKETRLSAGKLNIACAHEKVYDAQRPGVILLKRRSCAVPDGDLQENRASQLQWL